MKILHYTDNFSSQSETFVYDLINKLEYYGMKNYVFTHHRQLENERPFSKVKIQNNGPFLKRVYYKLFRPWTIRNQKEAFKYIKALKPDFIHAHFGHDGVRIYKLLKKYNINIPLVVSFHGADINVLFWRYPSYARTLLKMNLDESVIFTAPSDFLKRRIGEIGGKGRRLNTNKTYRIYNACNDIFNKVSKTRFWQYGNQLNLLNIARFEEEKGHVYLINAFKKIVEFYPNSRLTLMGFGSLERKLKQLVKKLHLLNNVIFIKNIEHKKLPDLLLNYDIYLQPSIVTSHGAEESLSVSTIETQTAGLPAIVSNIGGLKEVVVNEQTGYLIPAKSIDAIFNYVKYYIRHENMLRAHSINASKNAQAKFNSQSILKQWVKLYEERVAR